MAKLCKGETAVSAFKWTVLKTAATCRWRWFLYVVRVALRLPSVQAFRRFHSLLSQCFDPNDVRKISDRKFPPLYAVVEAALGERLRVNINDHIGWHIFVYGAYDLTPSLFALVLKPNRLGGTFIDVGANIGSSSIGLAKLGVPVIAIEASPSITTELSHNVAINSPIPYASLNVAVTDEAGLASERWVPIHVSKGNTGASSLKSGWNQSLSSPTQELTRLMSLDAVIDATGIEHILLIKIDIEGYEHQAIRGLKKTLAQRPAVLFEWRTDALRKVGAEIKNPRLLFPTEYQFNHVRGGLLVSREQHKRAFLEAGDFQMESSYSNVFAIPCEMLRGNNALSKLTREGRIEFDIPQ